MTLLEHGTTRTINFKIIFLFNYQIYTDSKTNSNGTLYENYWRKANGQQDVQVCPKKVYPQSDLHGCPQPLFSGTDSNTVCSSTLRSGYVASQRSTDSSSISTRPFSSTVHANQRTAPVCMIGTSYFK